MGEAKRRAGEACTMTAVEFNRMVSALFEFESDMPTDARRLARLRLRLILGSMGRLEVRKHFGLSPEEYWRALNEFVTEEDASTPRLGELDAACAAKEFADDFDVEAASEGSIFDDCRPEVGFNLAVFGVQPADLKCGEEFDWFRFLVWKYGANGGARMFFENGAFVEDLEECDRMHGPGGEFFTMGGTLFLPSGDRAGNAWPGRRGLE